MREKLIELIERGRDLGNEMCGKQDGCDECQYKAPKACLWGFVADHLIANGVTIQRWIPVSERLPNADEDVWSLCETVQVLLKDGTVTVGFCNRGLEKWYHVPILATTFYGHSYAETPVVAWQPLSQPPKEGE